MDILSIIGLALGFGAILGGQYLEGGSVVSLINGPAALIVFGGTFGAVMLQSPLLIFTQALKSFGLVFNPPREALEEAISRITEWSHIARKEGLLGLEPMSETEPDPFARKGLQLLVDGSEPEIMRGILEVEVETREQHDLAVARVYESMGGYSPTIGIIGAVMGLIQVMHNLSDPSMLGHGIAVAFVATIYGVAFANLLFLPVANKLKTIALRQSQHRLMVIEGLVAIADGENPRNIETKLLGYLH